ncbi:radical SAM protein [Ectothiorhodospiraceae bacterium BW-2]|nr:radical SAM protein [Ectothiorhodospiraceae bacterium BW-2]
MPKKMNLTNKLHQPLILERISQSDSLAPKTYPLVVELDTTEACDLACPGCISEDIVQNGARFSNERLLQLGEELYDAGVKAVVLIGGGEPLAHPAVGELIDYFGTHDIHIGITTNGTFIHKYLEPIAKYSSWTRVSMDAATNKLFQKLRPSKGGKSKFDQIIANMRQLAKVKQGKLGYSYLIQTEADGNGVVPNIHEIYAAAELARDIGCDYFEVKPSYQFRKGIEHALMKHSQEKMDQARAEIERLDELETDSFSIIKAINLDASLNGINEPQPKDYKRCPASILRTLIAPSGVFVCPYWRGKIQYNMGQLHDQSFQSLWHGQCRAEVMNYLDAGKQCNFHCLRHLSNLETIAITNALEQGNPIATVDEFDRFI